MYAVIFTPDSVEADLELLFVAFPFIISLFQLIQCFHRVVVIFIYNKYVQYIVDACMHKSVHKSVSTVLL